MISDEEYKKALKQFHKLSDRHILVAETDMSSCDIQKDNMKWRGGNKKSNSP